MADASGIRGAGCVRRRPGRRNILLVLASQYVCLFIVHVFAPVVMGGDIRRVYRIPPCTDVPMRYRGCRGPRTEEHARTSTLSVVQARYAL